MKLLFCICCLNFITTTITAQTQTSKEMKQYSTEIIRYKIPADKHGEFEKAYSEAGVFLKQSPYCKGYQLLHGEEEPNNYIVIIWWTSMQDHLNGFRKSEEFRSFFNLVKPFFSNI